jgi:hypothetical protein
LGIPVVEAGVDIWIAESDHSLETFNLVFTVGRGKTNRDSSSTYTLPVLLD